MNQIRSESVAAKLISTCRTNGKEILLLAEAEKFTGRVAVCADSM